MKTIQITCRSKDHLPLSNIVAFQGAFKSREQYDVDHIAESILRHGFFAPFFIWRQPDGVCSCLDGHGRQLALQILHSEGYEIPPLPVVYIDAKDEAEAREKLVYINTISGDYTVSGFKDLVRDLPLIDLSQYKFPTLDMDSITEEMRLLLKADIVLDSTAEYNPIMDEPEAKPPKGEKPSERGERTHTLSQNLPETPAPDDLPEDQEPDDEMVVHCPKCKKSFIHFEPH